MALPALFPRWVVTIAMLLAVLLTASTARAQQPAEAVEAAARQFVEAQAQGLAGEVHVSVGAMDPTNRLPPCARLAAFFPAGERAWGQGSVGVRCDSPVVWVVYLTYRVEVIGSYLGTARPLRAGQRVTLADLQQRRGDLASLPDGVLTDPSQALGHLVRMPLAAGAVLRADHLRQPDAVKRGRNVKVITRGSGFRISTEGRAMSDAAPGERVRVRLDNGRMISGTATATGEVEVGF